MKKRLIINVILWGKRLNLRFYGLTGKSDFNGGYCPFFRYINAKLDVEEDIFNATIDNSSYSKLSFNTLPEVSL